MCRVFPVVSLVFVAAFTASAANLSLSPLLVSNDYSGVLTFEMSGLPPGETVEIVQFYDFNGNGTVDGSDVAVRSDLVTDGQLALIGGATNINVLRDEDGAVDGSIRSSLRFPFAPDLARAIGSYVFRLSSPSNHFTAQTVPFAVASASYSQKVQGLVQCSGTNVPNAGVDQRRHWYRCCPINVVAAVPNAPNLDQPALVQPNVFEVRVAGSAGQSYSLQVTTDVQHWTDVLTTNAPADVFFLQDPTANSSSRFYRVRVNA